MAHRTLAALGRRRMTRRGFLVRAARASLGVSALGLVGAPIGARAQNDTESAPDAAASLADRRILLRRGYNEVAWTGPPTPVEALVANSGNGLITTVYHRPTALNELSQAYRNPAFFPGLPAILVETFVVQPGDGLGLTVAWDTPWPQPLLAPPPPQLREDNLDSAFQNRASWLGPDATPIAQALQGLQSSFGGIGKVIAWFFDRRAQEWLVYRSEGPAFFNTLAELHYGDAVNLTIDLNRSASIFNDEGERLIPDFPITWTQPAAGAPIALTRDDADLLVVADVVRNVRVELSESGRAVPVLDVPQGTIAVRAPTLAEAGDTFAPALGEGGLTAEGASYFYWVDDLAGALFEHPSRFVLVDQRSGAVTVREELWFPLRDGVPLFTHATTYATDASWLYPEPDEPEPGISIAATGPVSTPQLQAAAQHTSLAPVDPPFLSDLPGENCALVLLGSDKEWWDPVADELKISANAALQRFTELGFTTAAVGEGVPGFTPWGTDPNGALRNAINTLAQGGCRSITVYIVGHGRKGNGDVPVKTEIRNIEINAATFEPLMTSHAGIGFNFVVDTCYSGHWLTNTSSGFPSFPSMGPPNLGIVLTSSDDENPAMGDIDTFTFGGKVWFAPEDINADDVGTEWSSGFFQALGEIQARARARSNIRARAQALADDYVGVLLEAAAIRARHLDWAWLSGNHTPQTEPRNSIVTFPIPFDDEFRLGTVEDLPPSVTEVSPAVGNVAGGDTVVLTGEAFWGATVVKFGTTAIANATGLEDVLPADAPHFTVISDTLIRIVTPVLEPGLYTISVTTPEGEGTSATTIYRVTDAPVIAAVSPNVGDPAGGTQVTIAGTNLRQATAVRFGGEAAQFTVNDDGSLTVTTPPADAEGAVDVEVVTPDGTGTQQNGFTYQAGPQVGSLTPASGPLGGGTSVLASGANLGGITRVSVAGVALDAGSFSVTATSVTFTAPAQATAGPVAVLFETADGQRATATLTYVAVLVYQGNFIPLTQVRIASADACGAPHWHAVSGGRVVTLAGTTLFDPNSFGCGFGRVGEVEVQQ